LKRFFFFFSFCLATIWVMSFLNFQVNILIIHYYNIYFLALVRMQRIAKPA